MRITSFRHKDLERLWLRDEARGVARQHEAKLRAMLTAIEEAENVSELETVPGWRLHPLKGNRKGVWSLVITR
jgi:proteic killer suppression protein